MQLESSGAHRRSSWLRRTAAPLAWTLFFLWPLRAPGWLDGIPLGPLEIAALALVWWIWSQDRTAPGWRPAAVLLAVKILVSILIVGHGFVGRYYANASFQPPVERSADLPWRRDITRVDTRLAFGTAGERDLPLWFFNDIRFNFFQDDGPSRTALPFSVEWGGREYQREDGTVTFFLDSDGDATAELFLDNQSLIATEGGRAGTATLPLSGGWHTINVRVASARGTTRMVRAGRVAEGQLQPFDDVLPRPYSEWRVLGDTMARPVAAVLYAAALALLAWTMIRTVTRAVRARNVAVLLWLIAIAEALWFAAPYADAVLILSGGDDWLTYEHLARAIALKDPLLRQPGPAPGEGSAFYFQPFYPYFLALTHWIGGDGFFAVVFAQRLLVAATAFGMAAITAMLFGQALWPIALAGGGALAYATAGRWAQVMLGEPLFMPLFVAWAYLLIRLGLDPRTGGVTAVKAGLAGGLATLTRSAAVLAWPAVLAATALALPRGRRRLVAAVTATMIALLALVSIRNSVVSGGPTYVASSGGVVLLMGNESPRPLAAPPPGRAALYERLGASWYVIAVAEFALQYPVEFMANMGNKLLYSMGLFRWSGIPPAYSQGLLAWPGVGPVPAVSWWYVITWPLAVIGVARTIAGRRTSPLALALVPLFAALGHLAAAVIFHPHMYGDRMLIPLYPLLVPYAANAVPSRWLAWRPASAGAESISDNAAVHR